MWKLRNLSELVKS